MIRPRRPRIKGLRATFAYNPKTGLIRRRQTLRVVPDLGQHFTIWYVGGRYPTTHLIWAIQTGAWPGPYEEVDHINLDPRDNRWCNLRKCSCSQNQYNIPSRSPFKVKGVAWRNRKSKPWIARIRHNRKRKHLGSFATMEEAATAYAKAAKKLHGKFANLEHDSDVKVRRRSAKIKLRGEETIH